MTRKDQLISAIKSIALIEMAEAISAWDVHMIERKYERVFDAVQSAGGYDKTLAAAASAGMRDADLKMAVQWISRGASNMTEPAMQRASSMQREHAKALRRSQRKASKRGGTQ